MSARAVTAADRRTLYLRCSVTVNIDGEEVRYFHTVKDGVDRVWVDHPWFLAKVRFPLIACTAASHNPTTAGLVHKSFHFYSVVFDNTFPLRRFGARPAASCTVPRAALTTR